MAASPSSNPAEPAAYAYIKSYSPYDNVKQQEYPDLLIEAGLNDPRVGYWEAAKWAARLRDMKQGDSLLLLKTNMDTGHGGESGREQRGNEKLHRDQNQKADESAAIDPAGITLRLRPSLQASSRT